jgi:hypothetical protein
MLGPWVPPPMMFPPCPPFAGWYGPWAPPLMHFHSGWSRPARGFNHGGYHAGDNCYRDFGQQQQTGCHTRFLDKHRIFMACVPKNNNSTHTDISIHDNAKCHK